MIANSINAEPVNIPISLPNVSVEPTPNCENEKVRNSESPVSCFRFSSKTPDQVLIFPSTIEN